MAILVDERQGSIELSPALQSYGFSVKPRRLEFGDFSFEGYGPSGLTMVGIERKRLRDLIASIENKRFSGHQLPGLFLNYEFSILVVEGAYGEHPRTGQLEEYHPHGEPRPLFINGHAIDYGRIDRFLTSLEFQTPLYVRRTFGPAQTCGMLRSIWRWFQTPWRQHSSAHGFHVPDDRIPGHLRRPDVREELAHITEHPFCQRVAKELRHIGWWKSESVYRQFKTVERMVSATREEWDAIDGIGPVIADSAYRELRSAE